MVYNLFVEPGFRLPEMIKRATNRAVAKVRVSKCFVVGVSSGNRGYRFSSTQSCAGEVSHEKVLSHA